MPRRILLPLLAALTISACAGGTMPTEGPLLIPPAHLTALPPETLPQPASGHLDDLEANHIETAGIYHRARERYKALVEWLERTSDAIRRSP